VSVAHGEELAGSGRGEGVIIDEDLFRKRMLRGALRGATEPEKAPMKYCKGKLDNGRPCRIVMLGDEEYCRRHKKEIEALEAGAPLPVVRGERVQEDTKLAKHHCGKTGCTRAVKNEGEMCWQHKGLEDQVSAGTVEGMQSKAVAGNESATETSASGVDHLAGAGKLIDAEPAGISPSPSQEVEEAFPPLPSSLSRLLRKLEPVVQPLPPTSIVLDFDEQDFAAIQAEGVTAEEIKRLILMLIAGKLGEVVAVEDPLAKSRCHEDQ